MYSNCVAKSGLFALILFGASCVTEFSTSSSALEGQSSRDNPAPRDPREAPTPPRPQGPVAQARVPGAGQVGFYDMFVGAGQDYEIPPILAAGGTAITVADPAAAALTNLNVLFVTNPDNAGFGAEYVSRLADIAAAVQTGMVLVIHDRAVTNAAGILPAGAAFGIFRDFAEDRDVNIRDGSTVVTAGLDNLSLDNGNSSSHGFALDSTLPANAKLFLTSTSTNRVVTFCYPAGRGSVIYSTIPLDFYLLGQGPNPPQDNIAITYASNVVKFAIAGACSVRSGPRPTPNVRN